MSGLRAGVLFLACLALAPAQPAPEKLPAAEEREPDPKEVEKLVRQLGSTGFRDGDAATKRLEAIGEPALDALRKAMAESTDAEVRRRAEQLVTLIPEKLFLEMFKERLPSLKTILPEGWRVTRTAAR